MNDGIALPAGILFSDTIAPLPLRRSGASVLSGALGWGEGIRKEKLILPGKVMRLLMSQVISGCTAIAAKLRSARGDVVMFPGTSGNLTGRLTG